MKIWYYTSIVLFALSTFTGCSDQDTQRFDTPAATFNTHRQAIEQGDLDLLWETYSLSYRNQQVRATWRRQWQETAPEKIKTLRQREIAREEIINDEIAYLLFDPTTLENERQSPFYYFIREENGWKITTHLDSSFHHALEKAIEQGEYKLPERF
ncbi:MAG: hypothetical protein ACKVJG_02335 [Candidatus Latescibacterota bacterium]|jgi:hypothetical protein|tara:strand:- start:907 stop:1371 length:465 start_codon:yes stop_codon:yes gene_type:complete